MNAAERAVAQTLRAKGKGYKEIAQMLGKSATAIGNEIRSGGVAKKLGRPRKVSPRSSDPPPPAIRSHPTAGFLCVLFPPSPPAHLAPKQVFCASCLCRGHPSAEYERVGRSYLFILKKGPFCVSFVALRFLSGAATHLYRIWSGCRNARTPSTKPRKSREKRIFTSPVPYICTPKSPSPLARLFTRLAPLVLMPGRAVPFCGRSVAFAKSPVVVTLIGKNEKGTK